MNDAPATMEQLLERLEKRLDNLRYYRNDPAPTRPGTERALTKALRDALRYIVFLEKWPTLKGLDLPRALHSQEELHEALSQLLDGGE